MSAQTQLTKAEALELLRKDPQAALTMDVPLDVLLELQKELNPYANIVGPERTKKHLESVAMSITNLREDYLRRFFMTAITGFLFTMHREWEVPAEKRRWKTKKPKGKTDPFTIEELEAQAEALNAAIAMTKEARDAAKSAREKADKYNKDELVFTEEEMKGALAAKEAAEGGDSTLAEEGKNTVIYKKITEFQELVHGADLADGKYAGTCFIAALQLRNLGIDADLRLPATEKEARKYPNARAVLDENKGWERGLLPAGQMEVPAKVAHDIIGDFLGDKFEFNPDAHVRSAYDEVVTQSLQKRDIAGFGEKAVFDPYDPSRLPLQVLLEKQPPQSTCQDDIEPFQELIASKSTDDRQRDYNTICRLLKDPRLAKTAMYVMAETDGDPDRQERWRRMLMPELGDDFIKYIPPQDTFHRFKYYCDARYEELRAAVEALYHDKPDLEFAIQLMKHFEGSEEKVQEEARAYRDQHQNSVITDIKLVDFGGWTFLGEFDENRKKIDVHNDRAKLLQRILNRMDEDSKFGELLMRQRVRKEKAKNIAEAGPDHPGLVAYKAQNPAPGPEAISPEDRLRLERAKGNLKAADELKFFEEQELITKNLEGQARLRPLTSEEEYKLKKAYEHMEKAREMMEVPEDAIQIDVMRVNAKEGTVTRDKIHTRAVAPGGKFEDEGLSHYNTQRDELVKQLAAKVKGDESAHPVSFYPTASQALAQKAFDEGKDAPPLAPFAQDFLQQQLAKEREAADVKMVSAGKVGEESTESAATPTSTTGESAATSLVGGLLDTLEEKKDAQ